MNNQNPNFLFCELQNSHLRGNSLLLCFAKLLNDGMNSVIKGGNKSSPKSYA